jgi:hypothetical protein
MVNNDEYECWRREGSSSGEAGMIATPDILEEWEEGCWDGSRRLASRSQAGAKEEYQH